MHVPPHKGEEPHRIILVVDHEILPRQALAEYLRECGYGVVQAGAVDESLVVGLRWIAEFVVAVLCRADAIGTMSASEFARRVRAEQPKIPVLLAKSSEMATNLTGELCDEVPEIDRPYDHRVVVDEIRRRLAAQGHAAARAGRGGEAAQRS